MEDTLENRIKIASIFQEARVQRGLTQQELADGVGISWSTVQRFEIGKFSLKMDLIMKIAKFLEIEIKINNIKV